MIADALGNPLGFTLTGAEQADITQAKPLLDQVTALRTVIADKGYDADALVESIHAREAEAVIPPRSNRKVRREIDHERYRARHLIENLFARLKQFRRLATRYDKLDVRYRAFVTLAAVCVWLA